jgi:hypothetical protein
MASRSRAHRARSKRSLRGSSCRAWRDSADSTCRPTRRSPTRRQRSRARSLRAKHPSRSNRRRPRSHRHASSSRPSRLSKRSSRRRLPRLCSCRRQAHRQKSWSFLSLNQSWQRPSQKSYLSRLQLRLRSRCRKNLWSLPSRRLQRRRLRNPRRLRPLPQCLLRRPCRLVQQCRLRRDGSCRRRSGCAWKIQKPDRRLRRRPAGRCW